MHVQYIFKTFIPFIAWPVQMLTLFMIWWIFYNLSSSRSSTHRNAKNGATTVGGVMSMAIASAAHYRRLRQLSSSAVHTGKFRLSLWMQQCWVLRVPYWGQLCLMLWFLMFFFDVLFRCFLMQPLWPIVFFGILCWFLIDISVWYFTLWMCWIWCRQQQCRCLIFFLESTEQQQQSTAVHSASNDVGSPVVLKKTGRTTGVQ